MRLWSRIASNEHLTPVMRLGRLAVGRGPWAAVEAGLRSVCGECSQVDSAAARPQLLNSRSTQSHSRQK